MLRADHGAASSHTTPGEALLQLRLQNMGLGRMGWDKMPSKAAVPKGPPSTNIYAVGFFNLMGNALSCLVSAKSLAEGLLSRFLSLS